MNDIIITAIIIGGIWMIVLTIVSGVLVSDWIKKRNA